MCNEFLDQERGYAYAAVSPKGGRNIYVDPSPNCGAADQIVELDVATRSNELEIVGLGEILAGCGDSTFEGDGFECQQCSRRVSLPDGFKTIDWC
ncbi:hypothetical protein ACQP25_16840 [Microtetraspora malaysiensis]|uniref:hypothetical protein n=1 Tax=Microtetraspora malaysiensis TaxID=161358 RepID=UPI003D92D19B